VVVNVDGSAVDLPNHRRVLVASGPLDGARLPANSAVWLET
jgi:alpha-glucosidase